MTALKLSSWTWMAAAAMAAAQAVAQNAPQKQIAAPPSRMIVVSLQDRKLALVEDGRAVQIYPVAVGKPSTPSPVGTFTIERRVVNPTYYHNGRVIPPGPHNPVGTRWMGLSIRGYGIHGTNAPGSIGKAASHGCIRMARPDLERLFALVAVGDKVELIGQRDAETAELFGNGPKPAPDAPARILSASAKTSLTADKTEPAAGSL